MGRLYNLSLTVQIIGNGSVRPYGAGTHQIPEYADVAEYAEAATGWQFDHWELSLQQYYDPYALAISFQITDNCTLKAVFVPTEPQYSNVTITVTGQGIADPPAGNYPTTYQVGASLYVTAYPSIGWLYDHMNRNGTPYTSANPSEFLNLQPTENIEVVFIPTEPAQYSNVTITATGQGSTNPPVGNYPDTYTIGSSLNVSASPSIDWQYKHMKRNGTIWTGANPGEFANLAETENIEVIFEEGSTPPPRPSILIPVAIGGILGVTLLYLILRKS